MTTITKAAEAPAYFPPGHDGVSAARLQGVEASPTEHFWVGLSDYEVGGAATMAPTAQTVYVVVDGDFELTLAGVDGAPDSTHRLSAGDSVHMPQGTKRSIANVGGDHAHLLVIIATPHEG